jgi:small subunit ribosomal protein S3
MGKKVNPKVFRMGITRTWQSRWFSDGQDYINRIKQDIGVRRFLIKEFREAGVDRVEIERNTKKIVINIYTAKPGLIIGRGGAGIEELKKKVHNKFLRARGIRLREIDINIFEVDRPGLSSQIVLQTMIMDIEKRIPFRKVMKQSIARVEKAGALGVKVIISGRLNGAEIAREEMLSSGKVPLHTLRADIDYARGAAHTTYGSVGIKLWIYRGDVFEKQTVAAGEVVGKKPNKY